MQRFSFFTMALIISGISHSQDFKTIKSEITTIRRYYNSEAGIVLQKTINNEDSNNPSYEIGLVVFRKSISSDDFMGQKSFLEFKDGTFLIFSEQASFNYLYAGRHEIFLRHNLTKNELEMFKTKEIKQFSIFGYTNSLDKWQPDKILQAFKKIEAEIP